MSIHKEKLERLESINKEILKGGGEKKIQQQHEKGKLTARERIDLLLDPHSFQELGKYVTHNCYEFGLEKEQYFGDGVVTGYGTIQKRPVYVYSQDFTVLGGSVSQSHAQKIVRLLELSLKNGIPIIGFNDSGGARIQEGVVSLAGYADIFYKNTRASGVIPQISAIMGPCAGGAVYSPALTDFIFMVEKTSYMFVTGPSVVKTVTKEEISQEALGGAYTHSNKSGVSHFYYPNEIECIKNIKTLFSYIPQNCEETPPFLNYEPQNELRPKLDTLIPENPNHPYDMKELIQEIIDEDTFFEVHKDFAENIIIGFSRIEGKTVGIVANQPSFLAGVLDIKASIKAARFIRFCDCFNIPLLVLVDVPGFLPGSDQEWNGIITHGAKLLYAFSEATVPRITVITRKAYGGAYDVMNSKHIGADINFAWPTAEIAVIGARGASEIIFKNEIKNAPNPEVKLQEKINEYTEQFATPYHAAKYGYIDEVIIPSQTRIKVMKAFKNIENKVDTIPKKKHGNIPL